MSGGGCGAPGFQSCQASVLIRNVLSLGMVIGLMTVMTLFQGQTGQAQDIAALIQSIQTWLAPVYW